jgi:hypothetical protein
LKLNWIPWNAAKQQIMKERLNLTSFSQVGTYRKWMGFPIWKHRVGYFRLSLCRDLRWVGMELLEVPRWCWAKKERYKDLAGSWNLRELECVAAKPVAVKSRRRFSKYNSVEDFTAKYLYFSKQSPNYIWERYLSTSFMITVSKDSNVKIR